MKFRIISILTACTLLLAGCAAGEGSASSALAVPSVSTAAEPAATPEPTSAPNQSSQLEYTTLPLDTAQDAATACQLDTIYIPNKPEAEDYARQFAWGLYNRDADAVRAACSDRALNGSFLLDDLDGLCITAFSLGGGEYDTPTLTLTVADPGATPLLRGQHSYYMDYDSDGKIGWLCLYGPGAALDYKLSVARYDQTIEDDALPSDGEHTFIATATGDAADTLGLIPAAANLECYDNYWLLDDDAQGRYEKRNQQALGTVDAPPYGITRYGVPPEGNALTDNKLEVVCEALNQHLAALANGSYTGQYYTAPCNEAQLSAWDAAVPLPVAVTPDVLRSLSTEDCYGTPCTDIWVPLSENCWAILTINSNFSGADTIEFAYLTRYCQAVPDALAAALSQ